MCVCVCATHTHTIPSFPHTCACAERAREEIVGAAVGGDVERTAVVSLLRGGVELQLGNLAEAENLLAQVQCWLRLF